eukprot:3582873-Pleurochrysis_carterae.AAC.1
MLTAAGQVEWGSTRQVEWRCSAKVSTLRGSRAERWRRRERAVRPGVMVVLKCRNTVQPETIKCR